MLDANDSESVSTMRIKGDFSKEPASHDNASSQNDAASANELEYSRLTLELEKERNKGARERERTRRRKERWKTISPYITGKSVVGAIVAVIALGFVLTGFVIPAFAPSNTDIQYLTSSQLEKVVYVSKLSTAVYVYNGIAEIPDENGSVTQRISYCSTVRAGVEDMGDITFLVDDHEKTVTPVLPEIVIGEPSVDGSSFDYMPRNPNMELAEIMRVCTEDAHNEVQKQTDIRNTAESNLKKTVEALTLPLINNAGYSLVWDDSAGKADAEKSDKTTEAAPDENGSEAGKEQRREQSDE